MLILPLEPTDDLANPIFKDAASCGLWLGQLQLTNLQLAHSQLLYQIGELNRFPMNGIERLNTLELLRETVGFVQDDYAKKLIDKPLPLNDDEMTIFMSLVQLWQAMLTGYQRCLQFYIFGEKELSDQGALLCQRCLYYGGLEIFEYLRTRYEFSPALWRQMHALYAYAEQHELHQIEVAGLDCKTSCTSSYVKTLLSCYANPAELSRWQLQQMNRWLSAWSSNLSLSHCYKPNKNDSEPLAVDISSEMGLQKAGESLHKDTVRYLDMVPMSKLLRVKAILLQQGQTAQQVGLGDQYDSHACHDLLILLHQCWCGNRHKRSIQRKPVSRVTELCCQIEGIHAYLSQKDSKPSRLGKLAIKQIETMGYVPNSDLERAERDHPLESWLIENENIIGARITRADAEGRRFKCKQLVALRAAKSFSFMLATVAWMVVTRQGRLQMGIKYLPGKPIPVRISAAGINLARAEAQAFLMPVLPSVKTPASLIIPRGWFQPGLAIELRQPDGNFMVLQLGFSVERGFDFERVSFTPV